jgi:hypothetical protein
MIKEFEIGVEEGVDLGFGIEDLYFPMWSYKGNSFIV